MSGGGPFSGRLTANYCIAGAIAKQMLDKLGIKVDSYISNIVAKISKIPQKETKI